MTNFSVILFDVEPSAYNPALEKATYYSVVVEQQDLKPLSLILVMQM